MSGARGHFAVRTILTVALGGFLVGLEIAVFSGAVPFVARDFALGSFELGWAVSSLTVASTLAIFLTGPLADRFGRRRMLQFSAVAFFAAALLAALATNYPSLIAARLLSGCGVGAVFVTAPMYIAELAPAQSRGRMVSFNQFFIVLGISAAFFSNYFILELGHSGAEWVRVLDLQGAGWRWMLGIGAVPALIYFIVLLAVPESPRWLAMKGKIAQALVVLKRVSGERAEAELAVVTASIEAEVVRERASFFALWRQLKRVVAIGLVVGIVQQVTGINAVLAYAPGIFQRAGAGEDSAFLQAAVLGVVNLVFTVVSMLLIDRAGRRPLLLWGTAGIALSMFLMSYGFRCGIDAVDTALVLTGALGFIASFAVSLGPIMWVLFAEIFPNRVRGIAISFVGLVNSSFSFIVQFVFPWETEHLGDSAIFAIYGTFAVLGWFVMWRILPETRGRSLEQLEASLVDNGKGG
jgi:SP family arabinose:H+ symporter-like MFS transporter